MIVYRAGQHGHVAVDLGGGAQHLQQLEGGAHVFQARYVGELNLFVTQQGGEQDGQGGILAPEMVTSPERVQGPVILNLSMVLLLYQIRRAAGIYARVSTRRRYRP